MSVKTVHVALDCNRHVFDSCPDDDPSFRSWLLEHIQFGVTVKRVPQKLAYEVLYTTVPENWPKSAATV